MGRMHKHFAQFLCNFTIDFRRREYVRTSAVYYITPHPNLSRAKIKFVRSDEIFPKSLCILYIAICGLVRYNIIVR